MRRAGDITHDMRNSAAGARVAAQAALPLTAIVDELAKALNLAADLLDAQQQLLIELRNHKADA
jgi:hypothetical protein